MRNDILTVDLSMNFLRVEATMRGRVNIIRIEFSRFHFLRPLYFRNNHLLLF